jgi:hypothetical protein
MDRILHILEKHPDLSKKKNKTTPLKHFIDTYYRKYPTNPRAKMIIKRMIAEGADPHDYPTLYTAAQVNDGMALLEMLLKLNGSQKSIFRTTYQASNFLQHVLSVLRRQQQSNSTAKTTPRVAKQLIERLLKEGADPHDASVLHQAAFFDDLAMLKMLMKLKGGRPGQKALIAMRKSVTQPYDQKNAARLFIDAGVAPSKSNMKDVKFKEYKILHNSASKIQAAVRGHLLRREQPSRHTDPITLNSIPHWRQFPLDKKVYNAHSLTNYLIHTHTYTNDSPRVPHSRRPLTRKEIDGIQRRAHVTGWYPK